MKKLFKYLRNGLLTIIIFIIIYFFAAFTLSRLSTKGLETAGNFCPSKVYSIYILTNGVHTDLVLPIKSELKDWNTTVNTKDVKDSNKKYKYVAFGWGDKGFYLDTPTWNDLTVKTALVAAFGLGETAIHTTFRTSITESENCKKIILIESQYLALINFIENSFKKDSKKTVLIETDANYSSNDVFYEAKGKYSIFHTCNTWANNGLKASKTETAIWTPFDSGIFHHFK